LRAGSWLICLYNPTATAQDAVLDWNQPAAVIMHLSDPSGHIGTGIAGNLKIAPWGSVYLRVDGNTITTPRQ